MKQKVLIISLILVVGLVLTSLLTITSLSLTKQIKSIFSDDNNELFVDFVKLPTEETKSQEDKGSEKLLDWLKKPPTGELKFVEEEKNSIEKVLPILNLKEKIFPTEDTTLRTNLKEAVYYSLLVILLFIIIYFLRLRYKKKNIRSSTNQYEADESPPKIALLKNKDGNEITPHTKEECEIHEIRKSLQKWEAGLVAKKMKREAETINEWFDRIKGPIEIIHIYEGVRYGEKTCTDDELAFIKKALKL